MQQKASLFAFHPKKAQMRKETKRNLAILADTTIDLKSRLKKINHTKADVMLMFDDPEVREAWLENCRGLFILPELPNILEQLAVDAKSAPDRLRGSYQKLYFQVAGMLQQESHEHKHLHLSGMSDEQMDMKIQAVQDEISQLTTDNKDPKISRNVIDLEFEEKTEEKSNDS